MPINKIRCCKYCLLNKINRKLLLVQNKNDEIINFFINFNFEWPFVTFTI